VTAADYAVISRRELPSWAVLLSMVATELSAATFIGVPHAAYGGDWAYLQFAFGALAGKLVLAGTAIPLYHQLRVVTVYEFLERRFGPGSRLAAALCFIAGRVLASGVRLFIAALAFAVVTGLDVEAAIVVCGVIAGLYTLAGGIRAVVWTDVLQGAVFLAAGIACVVALALRADGGLPAVVTWADAADRMQVLHWAPVIALGDTRPFLVGLVGGFFLTLATHGTDYDMVQRLLTTRDGRASSRALVGSALLNFPLTALFLFIGTGLAFAHSTPPPYDIADTSRVLPIFALHELPSGARGLLFAGLFAAAMSSFDSAVCAIATTFSVDVLPRAASQATLVRRLRIASVAFCGLLIVAALAMSTYHRALADAGAGVRAGPEFSLVDLALSAMTILYGGLLGVFALGIADQRRGDDASAVAGLAVGGLVGGALFLHPLIVGRALIAWPWWIPIAATAALLVAAIPRRED
jgi:SSS family transporter